ncbi:MAG TPA: carboxypeptidase-like regulatory domain-containing protein [Gemmatimonadales bacterium]|jgi:hypothetical protein|nr:carboxypeptidase-like regulatory domain-containing protein [Gemmatimonadales bacterium]
MNFRPALGFLLLTGPFRPAQGQLPVHAPGGTLAGLIQDSVTGLPVGYALVILVDKDQRIFARESGRFTLTGLSSGTAVLRVQQIGYRAVTLTLSVETRPEPGAGGPGLVVSLERQPFVLPQIVVEGAACAGAELGADETGTVLDEAFRNAERLLTLERAYPFQVAYQKIITLFDTSSARAGGRVDTLRYDSRYRRYRRGEVLVRSKTWSGQLEQANYFSVSDMAGREFRTSHCFWYAGRDSLEGFQGYRIAFAPTEETKSVDWAGSLLIDSATMTLLQSEAHLVNLPSKGSTFRSAACTWLYKQLLPTLVLEFQARCVIANAGTGPLAYTVERWLLIDHRFFGKRPDAPDPPK